MTFANGSCQSSGVVAFAPDVPQPTPRALVQLPFRNGHRAASIRALGMVLCSRRQWGQCVTGQSGARKQLLELVHRDRTAAQEALVLVTVAGLKEFEIFLRFDALREDVQFQLVPECDHARGNGGATGVGGDAGDEAAVDLERGDREILKIPERRAAGAEVVDREAYTEFGEFVGDDPRSLDVA